MSNLPNFSSSLLAKAKVLDKGTASRAVAFSDPIMMARQKFISAAEEQLAILDADERGEVFISPDVRVHTDKDTGETSEKSKRLRRWYWKNGTSEWRAQLYYGNKQLIEQVFAFTSIPDLQDFITGIIQEAKNGVLDDSFAQFQGSRGGKKQVLNPENPQVRTIKAKNGR